MPPLPSSCSAVGGSATGGSQSFSAKRTIAQANLRRLASSMERKRAASSPSSASNRPMRPILSQTSRSGQPAVLDHPQPGSRIVERIPGRAPALALVEHLGARLAVGHEQPQLGEAPLAGGAERGLVQASREPAPPVRAVDEQVAHVAQPRVVDGIPSPRGGHDRDLAGDRAVDLGDDAVEVLLAQVAAVVGELVVVGRAAPAGGRERRVGRDALDHAARERHRVIGRRPSLRDRAGHRATAILGAVAAIDIDHLTKRYGETVAVDDLSFKVEPGRLVGFLGPNGAGKTTTLRALLGLIRPTEGTATVEGRTFVALEDPAHTVGAVLDGGMLHPSRSGRNHLRMLARAAGVPNSRADELLELVDLTDAADRRAGGYSLGMRQRLGLPAALLGDPRVLVLDEPANGLDPQGIRWLRDFLRSLAAEGRAVLVSSHVLAEVAQTADEVVVIARGRSVAQAPLAELTARSGGGMRVTGPDVAKLGELLRADGADVSGDGDRAILVRGRTGEDIGRVIAGNGIVISELAPSGSSLEEIFFELTGAEGGPS